MFGLNKDKSKSVEDESIKDKSKFVVVGFTIMILSLLILIGSEIFTSMKLSNQNKLISSSNKFNHNQIILFLKWLKQEKNFKKKNMNISKK